MSIALVLLCGIALQPARSETAVGVCDAHAKVADLNLTFKDIQGKSVNLSDYKGKVILLDFWATWCPPCRKEIPGFVELYNTYKSRGLVVIGVSMDDADDISDVKRFAAQINMNYPILLGAGREDDLKPAFGELPLPTSFVIARDGRICARHDGLTAKEQVEREIAGLLQ
ncbi:MAG: TlpA disulfide reductase family protein [Bryobacteraceae bacterium]|jgi:peroxiredoxin